MTAPLLSVYGCAARTLTTLTPTISVDPGGSPATVTFEARLAPDTPEGDELGGPNVKASATTGPDAITGPGTYAPTLVGLLPARIYRITVWASNSDGTTTATWECSTEGATVAAVPPGGDDRLYNIAVILKEMIEACLEPRCYPTAGVFPAAPEAPCDLLGVYLDPNQPVSQAAEFDADQPCAAGELVARFVIHLQRCCAVPEPVISEAGQVLQWVNVAEMNAVSKRLMRDLATAYQCVLCKRDEVFGSCAPLRVTSVATQVDSCYVHTITVDIPFDSDCCAGGGCVDA